MHSEEGSRDSVASISRNPHLYQGSSKESSTPQPVRPLDLTLECVCEETGISSLSIRMWAANKDVPPTS